MSRAAYLEFIASFPLHSTGITYPHLRSFDIILLQYINIRSLIVTPLCPELNFPSLLLSIFSREYICCSGILSLLQFLFFFLHSFQIFFAQTHYIPLSTFNGTKSSEKNSLTFAIVQPALVKVGLRSRVNCYFVQCI